jgi:hypothetical protein
MGLAAAPTHLDPLLLRGKEMPGTIFIREERESLVYELSDENFESFHDVTFPCVDRNNAVTDAFERWTMVPETLKQLVFKLYGRHDIRDVKLQPVGVGKPFLIRLRVTVGRTNNPQSQYDAAPFIVETIRDHLGWQSGKVKIFRTLQVVTDVRAAGGMAATVEQCLRLRQGNYTPVVTDVSQVPGEVVQQIADIARYGNAPQGDTPE